VIKRVCDNCGRDMPMYPAGQVLVSTGGAANTSAFTGDLCSECLAKGPFSNPTQTSYTLSPP
jgi:hypothetical protein